jgi:hypothetical protein
MNDHDRLQRRSEPTGGRKQPLDTANRCEVARVVIPAVLLQLFVPLDGSRRTAALRRARDERSEGGRM